jgi:hypothetical protein
MQVVRTEGVEALRAVVHLVPGAPQPVPFVRGPVVPVVEELIDQYTDHGAAKSAQAAAVDEARAAEQAAPQLADPAGEEEDSRGNRERTQVPVPRRRVAARPVKQVKQDKSRYQSHGQGTENFVHRKTPCI